jgi:hypothetical protein
MLALTIFGVTAAAIVGTRFRVLVLVPVIFFAAATIIAAGFVNGFGVTRSANLAHRSRQPLDGD